MGTSSTNSPLLGYNTNIKHAGHLFHIQTEDSGVSHPHIITHLFTDGTILATKKTSYVDHLRNENWEAEVRQLMKDQHKAMFVELRDGIHDDIASRILGKQIGSGEKRTESEPALEEKAKADSTSNVKVVKPASMKEPHSKGGPLSAASPARGRSIFETPDSNGTFGESLISDKSLDDVILDYLEDELED